MDKNAWHEHCKLRDDVREGTLELAEFAADLYAVRMENAPEVYQVPNLFFDRTYPTYNLKTLVRDVLRRLAGQEGNPVITVQVAYGGGKTHALIALLHLAERGYEFQTHPTVREFIGFSDLDTLPRARVALLPFDKFDVKNGLTVIGPGGKSRQVKTPWGALAYQLAGDVGFAMVAEHEADYINPAEQTLVELIKAPQKDNLSTLILLDEALMYTRAAVNDDPKRIGILQDFFQALTQAVDKVNNASIVASLITSDIIANDPTGVRVLDMLENVFHRMDKPFEPVSREDVAELLRRRLFEDVPDKERRAIVDRLVAARQKLPLREEQKDQEAYDELVRSYPFHPDFIEVFYQKWTQLEKFQGTRGMFRTFALLLRDAEGKGEAAFVGPSALLGTDDKLSDAMQELIKACEEGTLWTPILTGELEKVRDIQKGLPLLQSREIETAVISAFLHSQPMGHKAEESDLYLLLAHQNIDPVSAADGLSQWRKISWFLKENDNSWALGTNPNLTRMHDRAMGRLTEEQINEDLTKRIKNAYLGRNSDKVEVHTMPQSSTDISDNAELHFVIVRPELTAVAGEKVSEHLAEFFNRTYRNNVIVLAPENSLLTGLRQRIRKILGWENIESRDDMDMLHKNEPLKDLLKQRKQEDGTGIYESVISAYSVLITVDEEGEIKAQSLPSGKESPFERMKNVLKDEERLLTTSLDPDLLTPESYYELWGEEETAKPVQGLYGMFASLSRLPRMLNRQVFIDTLRRGVTEGKIVLRTVRPDKSQQTYWREVPNDDEELWKKDLEIVPIEHAELHNLNPELLRPGQLSEIWQEDSMLTTVGAICDFFDGDIGPKLGSDKILLDAIKSAIQNGLLMARLEGKAYQSEIIPEAEITDDLELLAPLAPISGSEIGHTALPDAWENETASISKIMDTLAVSKGTPIPWSLVVHAVNEGLSKNIFEFTKGSPAWPCSVDEADKVGLKVSKAPVKIAPEDLIGNDVKYAWDSGQSTLGVIKETLEAKRGISITDEVFRDAVTQAADKGFIAAAKGFIIYEGSSTEEFYNTSVRQPSWIKLTESFLTETEIQDLSETVSDLAEIAPELEFKYRMVISAEGDQPSDEVLKEINEALQKITDKLKFD